jgi:hypothetical protein
MHGIDPVSADARISLRKPSIQLAVLIRPLRHSRHPIGGFAHL